MKDYKYLFATILSCLTFHSALAQSVADVTGSYPVTESWSVTTKIGNGSSVTTSTYTGTETGTLAVTNGSYTLINETGVASLGGINTGQTIYDENGIYEINGPIPPSGEGSGFLVIKLDFFFIKIPVPSTGSLPGGASDNSYAFDGTGTSLTGLSAAGSFVDAQAPQTISGYINEVDVSSTADLNYVGPPPFTWMTNNGTITLTGYTGSGGAVTIPSTINGLPVISVGDYAFEFSDLTSVIIPSSVINIGEWAFGYCSSLTSISISNGVTRIGDDAFYYCPSLTTLTIPNSVTNIGDDIFDSCYDLTAITVNSGNPAYIIVAGILFNKSQTDLIQFPIGNMIETYTIPNTVTNIMDSAFAGCNMTNITIPNSVVSIGNNVFESSGLTSVTIPKGVTTIGDDAFALCSWLAVITVNSNNPEYISVDGVLFNKTQTSLIQYPPAGNGTTYTIPDSVTEVEDYAFTYSSLTNVTIPNSVVSLGNYALSETRMASLTIPSGVTFIGDNAFSDCISLASVSIPNSVTNIGDSAFEACPSLTSVMIPNADTSIGNFMFDGDTSLSYVMIPNSVTSIGNYAFSDCTSLTNIVIPTGITNIGEGTFFQCARLTNVTIPHGVTSIGEAAFELCANLSSVTLPDSVTNIADYAFADCYDLTTVYFQGNAPSADATILCADTPTVYYLPETTGWNQFLQTVGLSGVLWNPQVLTTGTSFGVQTNRFGFNITGTANIPIVVEATTNVDSATWMPLFTGVITNGSIYFNDPKWTNYPGRYYRLAAP